ncbi:MAG: hypothetical protein ACREV7_05120 [Steroidobacteraceae bacterium]
MARKTPAAALPRARGPIADLPWIPLIERLYGYRFVEHVIVDRLHFGTSADWGLHGGGDLDDQRVSYAVSIVNGNGFKNSTGSKSMDVEARLAVAPLEGLTLAVGGYPRQARRR